MTTGPGVPPPSPVPVDPERARRAVLGPGIGLIVTSALAALLQLFGVVHNGPTPEQLDWIDKQFPQFHDAIQQIRAQGGPHILERVLHAGFLAVSIVALVGAVRMLSLRGWGLAVAASIIAIVDLPCCCCLVGPAFGIWGLIVLYRPDVQAAFGRP